MDEALANVTHMAIVAHPDDIEVMAMEGVLECFDDPAKGFMGAVSYTHLTLPTNREV